MGGHPDVGGEAPQHAEAALKVGPCSPLHSDWDAFNVSGPEGVKFDLNLPLVVDADGDLDVINSEENDNARARARYLSRPFHKFAHVIPACTGRPNMRAYSARERPTDDASAESLSDCAVAGRTTDVDSQGGEIHASLLRGDSRQDDSARGGGMVE
jgi:hypothetical protein